MGTMSTRENERGFSVYAEYTDTYGSTIRVQESSHIDPRVWIFVECNSPEWLKRGEGALHLDEEGVDRLIAALLHWKSEQEA